MVQKKFKQMRQLILSTSLMILFFSAQAQIEKGSWLLDFYGHSGYETEEEIVFPQLYAKVGYLPLESLAVGVRIGGSGFFQNGNNFGSALYAVFGRYYINPQAENFHFFGELESGLLVGYQEGSDSESRFYIRPATGMSYELTEGLGLEVGLGFTFMESLNTSQIRYNGLTFDLGWRAILGNRSREALEETDHFFGRGTISLAAGVNVNNSFDQAVLNLRSTTEAELNSEAIRFTNLSETSSNVGIFDFGFGFFLSDRVMFDIGIGMVNYSQSEVDPAITLFSISPGLRYYLPLGADRTHLFVQTGYEFGGINFSGLGAESTYHYLDGGLGVNYMIGPSVALELGVDYGQLSWDILDRNLNFFKFYYGLRIFI